MEQQPPDALRKLIGVLDTLSEWSGRIVAWIIVPMVLGLTWEVVARYGFDAPTFWAYDMSYMMYGGHFMLGAAYTLLRKGHIRTDFFYGAWPVRRQAMVDSISYLFLFFPGMFFFFLASWDAAYHSWIIRETSEASAWRPIIYPFKMAMPVSAVLLILQGISEFAKSVWAVKTGRWL
ncbi:MAG: TRAP transporter small permease subunit [Candidatus Rokubacteria bacterium]|nr:TRAP transporter small permease subunit [Candidatus Rokubacteria bacterium]